MLVTRDDFKQGKYLIPNLVNDKTITNLLTYFEVEFLERTFCADFAKVAQLPIWYRSIIKVIVMASMYEQWQIEVSAPTTPIGQVNPEGQVSSNNNYSHKITKSHNDWVMLYRNHFDELQKEFAKIGVNITKHCFALSHPLLR